jgi:hypothetical protein
MVTKHVMGIFSVSIYLHNPDGCLARRRAAEEHITIPNLIPGAHQGPHLDPRSTSGFPP